jgi:hypothetical protein
MKSIFEIRQKRKDKIPANKHVFNKKIAGADLKIYKTGSKFTVFIDGEKLDSYPSQKEAEKVGTQFAKELRGMRG